jgi:hypothetical protein
MPRKRKQGRPTTDEFQEKIARAKSVEALAKIQREMQSKVEEQRKAIAERVRRMSKRMPEC